MPLSPPVFGGRPQFRRPLLISARHRLITAIYQPGSAPRSYFFRLDLFFNPILLILGYAASVGRGVARRGRGGGQEQVAQDQQ